MDIAYLWELGRSLPGSTDQIQWGNDRVFKVGSKMYLCTGLEADSRFSFKVDDDRFLELTDQPGIVPAPYLARAHWIQIVPQQCQLGDSELTTLIRHSHALVLSRLSKKLQREILAE